MGEGTRYTPFMIMPLEQLIEYDGNTYEITVAITRRAYHLAVLKTPEVEKNNGKVVSLATRQVFSKQVQYRLLD
jgi:DNA-directed RNA polymerase subunit omega